MNTQNYKCSITVNVTAKDAFDSINDMPLWWTEDFDGSAQGLGEVFTVHFGEIFKTMRVTEFIPEKK